ncbi:hypothetical protein KZX45_09165 [Georgenia sp. EYE_87]|uniref:hypothetical protein n=1 Tax=Georgenia sp. EYE_87 TaxID=2853448 RepID=UPI0020060F50|nr:hypothetical protein [Georgenia sp. EYE_87]MCK6210708.1 hypothetical protein [Georgenia sp. EYE_87]
MSGPVPDPDAVAAAVRAVPSVRLHEGSAVGTHLPGRRISGIRVRTDRVEVHAAVVYPATVDEAARDIRAALAGLTRSPVDVTIDDVVVVEDAARATPEVAPGPTGHERQLSEERT